MRFDARAVIALLLSELLVFLPAAGAGQPASRQSQVPPRDIAPLWQDLQKSYLELFKLAPSRNYTPAQIQEAEQFLKSARENCVGVYKKRSGSYDSELQQTQAELRRASAKLSDPQRHDLHCQIQNLRVLKSQAEVLATHAIPIAYENKAAKLELIQKWPAQLQQIRQEMASGSYNNRRWGDVKDIGFREIARGQEDDIKKGQDAIKQMKLSGLLPKEVEDKEVVDYVTSVAQKVAAHSDLHVPLHVTVLNSKEINAFALPGGYLFIERGLLEAADDESELAGVIAHETAHDVARHAHKLMTKATIAGIFYQAAELAAIILTGGAASIGVYYALQYGFYGLGLVLDLKLLGVSREYELEADQLGIQYAWNAGYDPSGFIRFFDKIATQEGYVNGASWFRSHPPFFERMVDAEREIMFLPKKQGLIMQSSEFQQMKKALAKVKAQAVKEEKEKPSLLAPEQGCASPQKIEYQPGQPIESICSQPTEPGKEARK